MQKLVDRFLVAVYVALATLPIVAMLAGIEGRDVFGALPPAKRPEPTWSGVVSEKFQHGFAAWFESTLGLKGTSIGIDNAVLYHVFRETKPGAPVRIGDDRVLFLHEDVEYFNKHGAWLPEPAFVEQLVTQMAVVQRRFSAEGRALVPVIVPSKTSVWRDKLPARWRRLPGEPRADERVYRAFKASMDRHGVRYVDARQLITSSTLPRHLVWGPDARHWSDYAACLAMHEVGRLYGELTRQPPIPYDCILERKGGRRFEHVDYDLWRLLNAYGVKTRSQEVGLVSHPTAAPAAPAPSVLFIGTSFCWQLIKDAERTGLFGKLFLNYYNQTLYEWPSAAQTKVEPGTPAWREIVVGRDLYVLDLFESYLGGPGAYNELFLNELLAELDRPR